MYCDMLIQQWQVPLWEVCIEHQVLPDLVAAMIYLESRGDPNVISPAGAVGLMQVMPSDTGVPRYDKWFKDRPTTAELLNPQTNLEWGVRVLHQGLAYFKFKDIRRGILSYYTGLGAAKKKDALESKDAKDYLGAFEKSWVHLFGNRPLPWSKDE
jgi:soluble lytic murein transglycosylase-like protein